MFTGSETKEVGLLGRNNVENFKKKDFYGYRMCFYAIVSTYHATVSYAMYKHMN